MTATGHRAPTTVVRARRPVVPRPTRSAPRVPAAPGPARPAYTPPALPAAPQPRPEPRFAFRPDVEGLRGVAVLLVVLYHAGLPWLPGGFVGVDAFFVVSGYVITTLLVAEVRQHDGVSLVGFYARRCRRIVPAAGFVLAVTVVAGAVVLPPLARVDLARDVVASALYGGNWHFIALQTDYLRGGGTPSPVLHYWSLGVEEQFYLLWPFLFVGALALAHRLRVGRTTVLAVALTVLTAGSFMLSLQWTATSAPLAYLSSPSRGWQFAVGAWLALLLPVAARLTSRTARGLRAGIGLVGAAALGWAAVHLTEGGYPGTHALVPTLGCAALLAAGCELPAGRAPLASRVLSGPVLRRLGAWSFTWYLWHWPAIVLVAARYGDLTWPVRLAVAVGALVPAALTTRWLERPLRRSPVVVSRPRVGLALGLAATVLPVCAALVVGTTAVGTLDGRGRAAVAAGIVDRQVVRFDDTRTSGAVVPSPARARWDFPSSLPGCLALDGAVTNPQCRTGRVSAAGPVVLFGDSHAEQWLPAVQALAARMGTGVVELTKAGCPVADVKGLDRTGSQGLVECDTWRENTFRRLAAGERPALVVVSSLQRYTSRREVKTMRWREALDRLVGLGAPVVYVRDSPTPDGDPPACVSGALDDWSRCTIDRSTALWPDDTADDVAAGRLPGVHLVDLTRILCPGSGATCPTVRGGVLLYRDGTHLTNTAVRAVAPQFVAAVLAQTG